jgi:hypothetical protein
MVGMGGLAGLLVCACVGDSTSQGDAGADSSIPDASTQPDVMNETSSDAPVEAGPACNLAMPFGTPQLVPSINSSSNEQAAVLTPDELAIFFQSDRSGGAGGVDIYYATRASRTASFSNISLSGVSSPVDEVAPVITSDALTLYFGSPRPDNTPVEFDVYAAVRQTTQADFMGGSKLTAINSGTEDTPDWINAAATTLYFDSLRDGPSHVFQTSIVAGVPQPATAVSSIDDAESGSAVLSQDELTIYWSSSRPDPTNQGSYDVFTATRAHITDGFGAPQNVASVNSTASDFPAWLSVDACRLYISSNRSGGAGGYDLYVASRP